MVSQELKFKARTLYKELLYLGRNYPDPSYPVKAKLRACFGAHTGGDEEKILAGIKKAEYIKKELEMMYYLKKYRAMKDSYYSHEQ